MSPFRFFRQFEAGQCQLDRAMRFAGSQPRFFQACHRAIGGHMTDRKVFGNFGQSALAIALDEIRDR